MATMINPVRPLRPASRLLNIVVWALQIIAALVFLITGAEKLVGFDNAVRMFGEIGMGQWFRYLAGMLEVAGAVLMLVPSFATAGAGMLAVVMVGAVIAHMTMHLEGGNPAAAIVLLLVTSFVAWQRRDKFLK